jgi:hypothetical protein
VLAIDRKQPRAAPPGFGNNDRSSRDKRLLVGERDVSPQSHGLECGGQAGDTDDGGDDQIALYLFHQQLGGVLADAYARISREGRSALSATTVGQGKVSNAESLRLFRQQAGVAPRGKPDEAISGVAGAAVVKVIQMLDDLERLSADRAG